jgi:hypothetical protein
MMPVAVAQDAVLRKYKNEVQPTVARLVPNSYGRDLFMMNLCNLAAAAKEEYEARKAANEAWEERLVARKAALQAREDALMAREESLRLQEETARKAREDADHSVKGRPKRK